jgi:hypothetical protein
VIGLSHLQHSDSFHSKPSAALRTAASIMVCT